MEDIPSDSYSSPPSSPNGDDPNDILLKMNELRMESDLPPLNSRGEQVLDKDGQIRLTGCSSACVNWAEYTPDAEFYKVEAILRPRLIHDVCSALLKMGIRDVNVSDVKGFGDQVIPVADVIRISTGERGEKAEQSG